MSRFAYDLHLHSCLSPCGDNESTPDSIAGMGQLNGLSIMALTDHNTTANCPAFFEAARRHDIIPVAGMELTTCEEIHVVCLFGTLEGAMSFDAALESRRIKIPNRHGIFGEQLVMDGQDRVIGRVEHLLINATTVSYDEVPSLVEAFGGACYPAHIDKDSNGVIAILGAFPDIPRYTVAEVHDRQKVEQYANSTSIPANRLIVSSDAHYLWDIKEATEELELPADPCDPQGVALSLIRWIKERP